MNYLAVIVGIIFIVCIFIGYKHGLFRSALKLVLLVLSLLLSYFLSPMLADAIIQYTNVDEYFKTKAYSVIEKTVKENVEENLKNELGITSEDVVEEITDEAMKEDPAKVQQVAIINKMKVPEFIKTALMDNNHDEARKSLGVNSFYEYISTYISRMIINAMAFVLSFAFLLIIFAIASIISAVAVRIPIIGGINRLGGMLFGFFEALFIVWICFVLVAIIPDTQIGNWFFSQIDDSSILTIIYEKNIFMKVVTGLNHLL
ncbi:MAG: CvpA family protein [Clostridium sp.]|nr:CvpA family protein [Clostridium sp.]